MTDEAVRIAEDYYKVFNDLTSTMPLHVMKELVHRVNVANGWFDSDRTFGDDMALLHSEVSEAYEAFRDNGTAESLNHAPACPLIAYPPNGKCSCVPKPEGVGSELADVLVRLLDTCDRYGIDLELEFHRKMKYNATRGYRHGNKTV